MKIIFWDKNENLKTFYHLHNNIKHTLPICSKIRDFLLSVYLQ